MKYEGLAKEILLHIGGKENINELTHCFTRLRFKLKNSSKANKNKIEKLDGVISVVESGGQFQIVVGNKVGEVYKTVVSLAGISGHSGSNSDGEKEKLFNKILNTIAAIFTPTVPGLAGAGILKGFLVLLTTYKMLNKTTGTYQILNAAADSIFYFMPIILAYTAAKKFKASPVIAMIIGGSLIYPNLVTFMASGKPVMFMELPVIVTTYASTVIPTIIATWVFSKLESFLNKCIPDLLKTVCVPALSITIMVPLTLLVFGPFGNYTNSLIGNLYSSINNSSPLLCGLFFGASYGILVMFGAHRALVPIGINEVATKGQTSLFAFTGPANFSQAGAAFGTFLRLKDKKMKSVALSASLTALFGITEPAIYGVNLKYKKPMYAAIIAGGAGGAIAGISGSRALAAVIPSVLTLPAFIGAGFVGFLISIFTAFALGGVLTLIFGIDEEIGNTKKEVEDTKEVAIESKGIRKESIITPISGKILKLSEVEDEAFSTGTMGKGVAVIPSEGKIYAPFNGSIMAIFPTKHAIGIKSDNGVELLIHIGINTVELNGKYFESYVKQGDVIKEGDLLIEFNLEKIKEAGYSTTTPVIVTNSNDFLDVIESSNIEVNKGEKLISIVM